MEWRGLAVSYRIMTAYGDGSEGPATKSRVGKVAIEILVGGYAELPTSSFLGPAIGSLKRTTEPHFQHRGRAKLFCDRCGLNFLPKQSVCTRCNTAATRHWFQLMSLVTLLMAVACNAVVALLLLPRLASGAHSRLFRGWMWFDHNAALYGWVPIAAGLLAWDYLVWKEARPKIRGWFTRKLLTLSLAAGVAPILPWWIPAGAPPGQFLSMIGKYPGLPVLLAWAVVLVVLVLLCADAESRDYLLGHGKVLSVTSVGLLVLVLTMTMLGWAVTS